MNDLLSALSGHWLAKVGGGIAAYVAFMGALKGMLPDLSRNELLLLYAIVTSIAVVVCAVSVGIIRIVDSQKKARQIDLARRDTGRRDLMRILVTWALSGIPAILLFLALMSPSPFDDLCSPEYPSIMLNVHYGDGTSRLSGQRQPVIAKPAEKITFRVEVLGISESRRNDYTFLAKCKFGDLRLLESDRFEYISPKDEMVDYIIVYVTNQRTGQRSAQPFNVVVQ
ncbi:MAG: hypothetical protein FJ026_15605 [Chloroflexi bacterium]|nr:hypothetical protein [Chloroflexota bacterium]